MKQIIPRFNPYNMPDDRVLQLNTGREKELEFATEVIENNIKGDQPPQHILLVGPRGSGKSFFLRLLQVKLKNRDGIHCYLFPEEQNNFFQPTDFLQGILEFIKGKKSTDFIARWDSGGQEEWQNQIEKLNTAVSKRNIQHVIIGVENFDLLLGKGGAFGTKKAQFAFRDFLTETPWLTLIATTLYPDIDTQYQKALFHAFAKHELKPWQEIQHQSYLKKRAQLEGHQPATVSDAQLMALTRFTGGSPRITVIMTDVLSQDKIESTTLTLEHTIDILTPFYQDLLSRIPTKSRLLFDALVRGGEPCSQSDLAKRVGTTQNVISRSFNWLTTHQYLIVDIPKGEKQRLYSVRDRLLAHYYRIRHIHHQAGKSILAVMSEFLTTFYSSRKLKSHAENFLAQGKASEGRDLLQLAINKSGIDVDKLQWKDDANELLRALDLKDMAEVDLPPTYEEAKKMLGQMSDMLQACTYGPDNFDFAAFIKLLFGTLHVPFTEKIKYVQKCINGKFNENRKNLHLQQKKMSNLNNEQTNRLGSLSEQLSSAVSHGEVILEYLDKQMLDRLKNEKLPVYYAFLAMYHQKLKNLSSPEELLEAYTFVRAHLIDKDDSNLSGLAWNFARTGWNLEEMGRYAEALKAHQRALELWAEAKDISQQAWNLGQIGWNFQKLGRHEEALKELQRALALDTEEKDISGQAWNLSRIGWCLEELGRHEEALKSHQRALALDTEEKDISVQAWSLGRIGCCLEELGRHEEALKSHQRALELWTEEKDISQQAWNFGQIGWKFQKLGRHEEAIKSHQQALELWAEEKDISEQAWSLGRIGWCLEKLGRHEEALKAHQRALELWTEEKGISQQAWNFGQIGWNFQKLGRHEEAIKSHQQALELWAEEKDISELAWNLGQTMVNMIFNGQKPEAWHFFARHFSELNDAIYILIRQLGDVVYIFENRKQTSEAYADGVDIIESLVNLKVQIEPAKALQEFFIGMIEMRVSVRMLSDLFEYTRRLFKNDSPTQMDGVSGIIEYLKSDTASNTLIKMPPEKRKAVEAIIQELKI